jgi:hypothetical protein
LINILSIEGKLPYEVLVSNANSNLAFIADQLGSQPHKYSALLGAL